MIQFVVNLERGRLECKAPIVTEGGQRVSDNEGANSFENLRRDMPVHRSRLSLGLTAPIQILQISLPLHDLGDRAVRMLVDALVRGTSHVQAIELYKNRLGDASAQALAQLLLLAPEPGLHRLHLSHNFFTPVGVGVLLAAAASCGRYPMQRGDSWVPLWLRVERQQCPWPSLTGVSSAEQYKRAAVLVAQKEETLRKRCRESGRWSPSQFVPNDVKLLCVPKPDDFGEEDERWRNDSKESESWYNEYGDHKDKQWTEDQSGYPKRSGCYAGKCKFGCQYGPIVHLPYFWSQCGHEARIPAVASLAKTDPDWRTWAPRLPQAVRSAMKELAAASASEKKNPGAEQQSIESDQASIADVVDLEAADSQETRGGISLPVMQRALSVLASTEADEREEEEREKSRLRRRGTTLHDAGAEAWPELEASYMENAVPMPAAPMPVAPMPVAKRQPLDKDKDKKEKKEDKKDKKDKKEKKEKDTAKKDKKEKDSKGSKVSEASAKLTADCVGGFGGKGLVQAPATTSEPKASPSKAKGIRSQTTRVGAEVASLPANVGKRDVPAVGQGGGQRKQKINEATSIWDIAVAAEVEEQQKPSDATLSDEAVKSALAETFGKPSEETSIWDIAVAAEEAEHRTAGAALYSDDEVEAASAEASSESNNEMSSWDAAMAAEEAETHKPISTKTHAAAIESAVAEVRSDDGRAAVSTPASVGLALGRSPDAHASGTTGILDASAASSSVRTLPHPGSAPPGAPPQTANVRPEPTPPGAQLQPDSEQPRKGVLKRLKRASEPAACAEPQPNPGSTGGAAPPLRAERSTFSKRLRHDATAVAAPLDLDDSDSD